MRIISVKLPEELDRLLTKLARSRGASRSSIIRRALESFARTTGDSVAAAAADLVGCVEGPADLSTAKRHLAGFGE
ncbi:MAG: ribbon-helix-helix domain-containing protein [Planctomycetota bacterium]|jgi:predicted transcriptional regulator